MKYNFCPFCAEETTDDLDVHGQNCSEYQESLATNNCPFCSSPIEECFVQSHLKFRKAMKSKSKSIEYPEKLEENINLAYPMKRERCLARTDENLCEQLLALEQEDEAPFEANFSQSDLDLVLL